MLHWLAAQVTDDVPLRLAKTFRFGSLLGLLTMFRSACCSACCRYVIWLTARLDVPLSILGSPRRSADNARLGSPPILAWLAARLAKADDSPFGLLLGSLTMLCTARCSAR
jgi:hypothetical protein